MLLIGGSYWGLTDQPNDKLWRGSLSKDKNELIWIQLGAKRCRNYTRLDTKCREWTEGWRIKERLRPMCFKLKDNLYIAGGLGIEGTSYGRSWDLTLLFCDQYNLTERKYYESVYSLPYPVNNADKVVTSEDETFAIILNVETRRLLIFTEKDGFKEFSDSTFKDLIVSRNEEFRRFHLDGINHDDNFFTPTLFRIK